MNDSAARASRKKDLIRAFDELTGYQPRWQTWQDMIGIFATAISNAVDVRNRQKREDRYLDIMHRYDEERRKMFPELFARLVQNMDEAVQEGNFGDILGELFMEMNLGNNLGGQFFTPYNVCMAMSKLSHEKRLAETIRQRGYVSCNDPACGAGATMIAMAQALHEDGLNYQTTCLFVGQDIDETTALMCYIQLSLLGCAGYVHVGNTLTEPMTGHVLFGDGGENTWYTPMYFSEAWEMRRQAEILRHTLGQNERAADEAPEKQLMMEI